MSRRARAPWRAMSASPSLTRRARSWRADSAMTRARFPCRQRGSPEPSTSAGVLGARRNPECPALFTRIGEVGFNRTVGCHHHLIRIDYALRGVRRNLNGVRSGRQLHRVFMAGVRHHARDEVRAGIGFNIDHLTGRGRSSSARPGGASHRTGRRGRARSRNSTRYNDRHPECSTPWRGESLLLITTAHPGDGR